MNILSHTSPIGRRSRGNRPKTLTGERRNNSKESKVYVQYRIYVGKSRKNTAKRLCRKKMVLSLGRYICGCYHAILIYAKTRTRSFA